MPADASRELPTRQAAEGVDHSGGDLGDGIGVAAAGKRTQQVGVLVQGPGLNQCRRRFGVCDAPLALAPEPVANRERCTQPRLGDRPAPHGRCARYNSRRASRRPCVAQDAPRRAGDVGWPFEDRRRSARRARVSRRQESGQRYRAADQRASSWQPGHAIRVLAGIQAVGRRAGEVVMADWRSHDASSVSTRTG